MSGQNDAHARFMLSQSIDETPPLVSGPLFAGVPRTGMKHDVPATLDSKTLEERPTAPRGIRADRR
jgi:hypothetical protein